MALTRREALAASTLALTGCRAPRARPDLDQRVDHSVDGSARIGFVGDLVLARGVEAAHESDPDDAWGALRSRLRSLDALVGNLECTVSTRGERWPDKAFCFRADPDWATAALKSGGVDAVSLANNHSMDYGDVSLRDTVDHLDATGIAHAGAGSDREAAFAPATFEAGGLTVAMIGLTDRFEPFAAGETSAGTAHLDLAVSDRATRRQVVDSLDRIPGDVDLVVASLHWGPNYEPKTDRQRRFARRLLDAGVDVVHGHSAHEIHGVEAREDGLICYDTGNFLEDFAPVEGHHNGRSFLFELVVDEGLDALVLHPVEIVEETVQPASPEARRWLTERVRDRSARFDTAVVETDGPTLRVPLDG